MSNFGSILKNTLSEKGISQKWLAEKSNTTEATISRYVSNVHSPAILDIIADIAKSLNVSVDYLLGITNIEKPKDSLSTEEKILLSCFNKAGEDDRRVLWAVLDKYMSPQEKDYLSEPTPRPNANVG